jgi:alkanesulfonate monooxygenase SsuD/methylene tetrahydromethanopterin reductase-like flavin-dependent oxidoreductase (luciferase family)
MRLGCAVFITSLYSPVHLAKSLSTLDQLSRGRLEVGIGTGGRGRMFSAFGVLRPRRPDAGVGVRGRTPARAGCATSPTRVPS